MNLINLTTGEYPASLYQVRQENPNVSFSVNPTDEDLAPFGYANVYPTSQPTWDQRTQRIEEATPEPDADGIYRQQWIVRDATAQEIADYDAAHLPPPDWMGFGIELTTNPAVVLLFDAVPSPVSNGLSIGLSEASRGDTRLFIGLWSRLLAAGVITTELIDMVGALAQQFNLPSGFIMGLAQQPSPPSELIEEVAQQPSPPSELIEEVG